MASFHSAAGHLRGFQTGCAGENEVTSHLGLRAEFLIATDDQWSVDELLDISANN